MLKTTGTVTAEIRQQAALALLYVQSRRIFDTTGSRRMILENKLTSSNETAEDKDLGYQSDQTHCYVIDAICAALWLADR
jgi:hypothetical protein